MIRFLLDTNQNVPLTVAKNELPGLRLPGLFSFLFWIVSGLSTVLGLLDILEAKGAQLRGEPGQWGGRNLAARTFNFAKRNLRGTGYWAAAPSGMDATAPLLVAPPQPLKQR